MDRFSKNYHFSNFMKIRPVGAELFHAKGRAHGQTGRPTDRHDKSILSFAKAPKKLPTDLQLFTRPMAHNGPGSTFAVKKAQLNGAKSIA
jgi:hypothetical protein